MYKIKKLESNKYDLWDDFVASHDAGSIYHTSQWLDLISQTYGHDPHYIILENDRGDIIAGLPLFVIKSKITSNRLSTIPCAQACNPLVSNSDEYLVLIQYVKDFLIKENLSMYEMKTINNNQQKIKYIGRELSEFSTYILDIDRPIETIKNSLNKSNIQRALKKSLNGDLSLHVVQDVEEVKHFYKLYLAMRKNYGLLPQPYHFFRVMWEKMVKKNYIDILYAKYNNRIISALLLLKYKDTVIYEYGATLENMKNLRPSQFLIWNGILRSKEQGFKCFDFGRVANDNKSLSEYKLRWGTKRIPFFYYIIAMNDQSTHMRESKALSKIMYHTVKIVPSSINQIFGKLLYRNLL